ncbi:glycosyltransferase [Agromyces kandeliae]|uniref:D-inositol 3-phosphate glycosyltransferase n=1 Tax=Agromyces kandeliae TaxID=2666141 RepID=A0A6L5QYR1_9MICO|nr:glycosyltransferase [Agromyces kandeliae]MRX42901.1 glycosyltransferase [Agromyces kandeliae]
MAGQKPRLLVLASTFPAHASDGTPAFVRDLAEREAARFDVMVVVPRVPGAPERERLGALEIRRYGYFPRRWEDLADGAIIENLREKRSRWLQVLPFFVAQFIATRRAARDWRPDVAHVHWIIPQGVVARLALSRTPALLTTLGGDLYALNARPLRALKSSVVRWARAVTVMNAEMRERVIELGAEPDAVQVLPMGADLSAVQAVPAVEAEPDRTRILFVGRLVEKKGLEVLLDALRELGSGPTVSLTVVGDGPLRASLESRALGLDVTFAGQLGRAELVRRYAACDLAVFPSVLAASGDKDGLPVALLEAMAAGCAIVASDVPGINEAVEDGVNGVLVPPGDTGRLTETLDALVDDPALRQRLGAAARETAEQYSADAVGAKYGELLTTVASVRPS